MEGHILDKIRDRTRYEGAERIPIRQAQCRCGWVGPQRDLEEEAEIDFEVHVEELRRAA